MRLGTINIVNKANTAEIDIEGIIGIPERWQFDEPDERVATYDKFKAIISDIKALKASEIIVNIRSMGGNVDDALLIYDTLTGLGSAITTKCYGYVASAATIIAQAASEGKRIISDNSLYLIHRTSTIALGNANEMRESVDMLEKSDERLVNIYSSRSGKDAVHFSTLMEENNGNGKWLSPDEVIEAGLADSKIKGQTIVNMPTDDFKVLNLPAIPTNTKTIDNSMKIKNTWKAILGFFGFDENKDNELTEAQAEKLNNELETRQTKIDNLAKEVEDLKTSHATEIANKETAISEQAESIKTKDAEIANLVAQVSELEALVAKKKAEPTNTEAKNDPDPVDPKADPRTEAYNKDLECIKNQIK